MKTIKYYLDKLLNLKKVFVQNLLAKGVNCSDDDSLNTLVAKTGTIISPVENEISLPDFSLMGCQLSEEDLDYVVSKLNLSNPSTNISYKWYNAPNLKKLCLKNNWNITTVTSATSPWDNTLEELDLSDVTFSNIRIPTLPTSLKKIDLTNTVAKFLISFNGLSALEDIVGLSTLSVSSEITGLSSMFSGNKVLKNADLRGFDLSNCTNISSMLSNTPELQSFMIDESFNINNVSSIGSAFYNSGVVDDEFLIRMGLDNYDYTGKTLGTIFGWAKPEKDESGCYNLNEKLNILDFSNTTGELNLSYSAYDYRHLKKLNLKNCNLVLSAYNDLVGADSTTGSNYYHYCYSLTL